MSDIREIYESLSKEFVRKGIASNRFSELEKLYHFASDNEKLQPEWRKLNTKTIESLEALLIEVCEKIDYALAQESKHYGMSKAEAFVFRQRKVFSILREIKELLKGVNK